MYRNAHKARSDSEFSEYQKVIEATENVILCVAKAEQMVRSIGSSLIDPGDLIVSETATAAEIREEKDLDLENDMNW